MGVSKIRAPSIDTKRQWASDCEDTRFKRDPPTDRNSQIGLLRIPSPLNLPCINPKTLRRRNVSGVSCGSVELRAVSACGVESRGEAESGTDRGGSQEQTGPRVRSEDMRSNC